MQRVDREGKASSEREGESVWDRDREMKREKG